MNRRHSLPAEVYALVERSPATVLLECGTSQPENTRAENCTQLFITPNRVCVAYTPADVGELFALIENAVAAGQTAAGYFAYECGNCFEPKAGTRSLPVGEPLAWFGIYQRSYRFDHATGAFEGGAPPQLVGLRNVPQTQADDSRVDAALALDRSNMRSASRRFMSGFARGMCISLTSPRRYRLKVHGSTAALYAKLRTRQPVEYGAFHTPSRRRAYCRFRRSSFFAWTKKRRAPHYYEADERHGGARTHDGGGSAAGRVAPQ